MIDEKNWRGMKLKKKSFQREQIVIRKHEVNLKENINWKAAFKMWRFRREKSRRKRKDEKVANTKLKVCMPQAPPINEGIAEMFQSPP